MGLPRRHVGLIRKTLPVALTPLSLPVLEYSTVIILNFVQIQRHLRLGRIHLRFEMAEFNNPDPKAPFQEQDSETDEPRFEERANLLPNGELELEIVIHDLMPVEAEVPLDYEDLAVEVPLQDLDEGDEWDLDPGESLLSLCHFCQSMVPLPAMEAHDCEVLAICNDCGFPCFSLQILIDHMLACHFGTNRNSDPYRHFEILSHPDPPENLDLD